MPSYYLIGSETTVQVLSPTVVENIVYCTIETVPSGVVASIPVPKDMFDTNEAQVMLNLFSGAIEELMLVQGVIAAQGSQTIDPNGLIQDDVTFVVEYKPPGGKQTAVTAEAVIPVGLMPVVQGSVGGTLLAECEAIITGVYQNLVSAAGG